MTIARILIRRFACPCDGVGGCGRLAGEALGGGKDFHQSPTATTAGPARRHRSEQLIDESGVPPLRLLHSIWRIRTRGIVDFVMIDRGFVARLWRSVRSAVHEFKISRMQKKSDERFRVVEVSKCERRQFSSSAGRRPPLSVCCNQFKRSVRRRAGQAATVVACPNVATRNSNSGWGSVLSRRAGDDDGNDTEEDSVTDESAPINWTRWKEIEIEEFSPRIEIAAFSRSSKSMEDLGSLKWEEAFRSTSANIERAPLTHGESSSAANTTGFEHRRWENRYRVSDKSPQLLQPVKGKLTALSSLLRTMSDRYARRTGKLSTPVNDKSSNNNNNNKRPVLRQSQSAAPWPMQSTQQVENRPRSKFAPRFVDDVPVKRYDNPFQDFLRQSFAERHSRSVHETDRQR